MASLTTVMIDIIGRDKASKAFDTAAASAAGAAKKMDASLATITATGAKLTKRLTVPIVAVGAASLDMAMKWQKSQTLLQTAGGETLKKMQVIGPGIQKIAVSTGTSLTDLSDGMYTVAKAGAKKWSAVDQLKVLKAAAQGAKAENVDLGTATSALTSVMMSYGMKAGAAVKAEDMLIRGSALAKTTFQEFAGSLSNVVPLAAALHIKFSQVAGSLATMTQHGESPDQASQNLNNLITNLAGQNNVASTAMQQLGINTVRLTKNLGKSGISGALNVVEKALAKSSHGGMVVISAFRKAQVATRDLGTEIDHMSPHLANLSKQFESGKLGYKDYYNDVKALGGQQFELGKGFIATMGQAKGFNNIIRSGGSDVQTAATMLKKMLGGMTGMRAALMLTGTSAKQNAANIDQVAEAARKAGVDVLGWGKTSGTLSVKLGQAKANLQVLGVEIGTALIPAVTTIVSKVSSAVTWFENLGTGWKHLIGYSALVVGALGPVMTIIGRVGTAVKFLWTTMSGGVKAVANFTAGIRMSEVSLERMNTIGYSSGLKMRTALNGMGQAAKTAGSALAGAGIGFGLGELTKNANGAEQALGALGSTAGGALAGFAIGGPVGAAIGGVSGLMSNLATTFLHTGSDAVKAGRFAVAALQEQKSAAGDLYQTLQQVNGAYNAQYKAELVNRLSSPIKGVGQSVLGIASQAGVDPKTVVQAALGASNAIAKVIYGINESTKLTGKQQQAATLYFDAIAKGATESEKRFELSSRALTGFAGATRPSIDSQKALQKEFARTGVSMRQLVKDWNPLGAADKQQSAETLKATSIIADHAKAIGLNAQKELQAGRSVRDVASQVEQQTAALSGNLHALGFNDAAVQKIIATYARVPKRVLTNLEKRGVVPADIQAIIDKYNSTPKNVKTDVTADAGEAESTMQTFLGLLAQVPSHVTSTVTVEHDYINKYRSFHPAAGHADGGAIYGPGSKTSDSIPARLSNGEHVWTADEVEKAGGQGAMYRARDMVRAGVLKFAKGGAVPGIRHVGKDWIYGGIRYASLRAAENARTRDRQSANKPDTSAVGSAIGTIGQAYTKPIDVASVGIDRIEKQIEHARAVLDRQIANGLGSKAAAHFRAEIKSLSAEAAHQLAQLKVKIKHADVSALKKALNGTVSDARAAFATLLSDARAAGVSRAELTRIGNMQARVLGKMRELNGVNAKLGTAPTKPTAYDRLATAKSNYSGERSSVRSAVLGAFDITSAGAGTQVYNDQAAKPATGKSILAALKATVAKAKQFTGALHKLGKMGLPAALLSQLAQAGPDALDQAKALISSGAGTVGQIAKEYGQLKTYAGDAGTTSAKAMYGAGVKSAQKLVDGLLSQRKALKKAMQTLAKDVETGLDKALKSQAHTRKKLRNQGPPAHGNRNGHGNKRQPKRAGVHVEKIVINAQHDPVATANAVTRRLAHLGAA